MGTSSLPASLADRKLAVPAPGPRSPVTAMSRPAVRTGTSEMTTHTLARHRLAQRCCQRTGALPPQVRGADSRGLGVLVSEFSQDQHKVLPLQPYKWHDSSGVTWPPAGQCRRWSQGKRVLVSNFVCDTTRMVRAAGSDDEQDV